MIMYVRMLFLIVLSFYTSRLLLAMLGVEDFGIQSVIGSIASTFLSVKALFSESIQRFLNFEKGKNSLDGQRSIFTLGIVIHLILAFVFVALVEVIGCWLIANKLEIPAERIYTAYFFFHITVFSVFISIYSIPYDAVIIANEKMGIYALVTVIDAVLKLGAVFLLAVTPFDKLCTYAVLLLVVPLFTLSFQLIYCRRFPECKLTRTPDKKIIKELFSLSSWNFFGNMAFSLVHEGMNMLLNVFGGLIYNTARTIAYQVKGVASQLTNNTIISVRPKIMQQAASSARDVLFNNINHVSRIAFFTILIPVSMLLTFTESLLGIWLIEVPSYASLFTQIMLLSAVVRSLHEPLNMLYMALGVIKRMMIIESCVMIAFLIIIYASLKMGAPMWLPFVEIVLMEVTINILLILNANKEIRMPLSPYFKKVIVPFVTLTFIIVIFSYTISSCVSPKTVIGILFLTALVGVFHSIIVFAMLDSRERQIISGLLNKLVKRTK